MPIPSSEGAIFPPNTLSPELARRDPAAFKKILVEKVRGNPRIAPIFSGLESVHLVSPDSIVLRESWISETTGNNSTIQLGFHEIPRDIQEAIFYTASSMCPRGYEQQLIYRFTHEVIHKYLDFLVFQAKHPNATELLRLASEVRADGNVGFTAFGNIDNIGKPIKQASEDVTELLNMYVWNLKYFRDYLDFLANPHTEQLRQRYAIVGLEADSKVHMFQLVESTITSPQSSA